MRPEPAVTDSSPEDIGAMTSDQVSLLLVLGTPLPVSLNESTAPHAGNVCGPQRVVGVGIDVVRVADVAASLSRGARYSRLVLSPAEQAELLRRRGPETAVAASADAARWVATVFALKECVTKILDPRDDAWPWPAIEIDGDGAREGRRVRLTGAPARRATRLGVTALHTTVATDPSAQSAWVVATMIGVSG